MKNERTDLVLDFKEMISATETPSIYANGFIVYQTNADVGLLLRLDNQPAAKVHLSYTLAKTLSQKLANLIQDLERQSENVIMTTETIDNVLKKDDV